MPINLDTTTESIIIKLDASKATNNATCFCAYYDNNGSTIVEGNNYCLTDGTTAVTILSAPAASTRRSAQYISVYNNDTATISGSIYIRSGVETPIDYQIYKGAIPPSLTLEYNGIWSIGGGSNIYVNSTSYVSVTSLDIYLTTVIPGASPCV